MQHLVYDLEIDDMMAFAAHYTDQDPTYLKQIRAANLLPALFVAPTAVYMMDLLGIAYYVSAA